MSFHVPPTFPSMATMIGFSPPLPSPLSLNQSVMTQIVLEPKVPSMNASNYHDSDPVTKAVMDNIMGKLPTKKPVVVATCDICKLECSGQIVLDMHLAGAKHAKKVC
jgi:Zinc-finger of C2H2 type